MDAKLPESIKTEAEGQKNVTIIHHIIAKNTVDTEVIKSLKAKRQDQAYLMEALKAKIDQDVKS